MCSNAGKIVSIENGPNIASPPSRKARRRSGMVWVDWAAGMGNGRGMILWERLQPRALALAPPPAKAGGGWEGVPTGRIDQEDIPPPPSPAFEGEGEKTRA